MEQSEPSTSAHQPTEITEEPPLKKKRNIKPVTDETKKKFYQELKNSVVEKELPEDNFDQLPTTDKDSRAA